MFRDNEMRRYAAAVFIVLLIAVGAGFAASGLFEGKTEPDTTAPTGDATAETAFRSTPIMPAASTPTPKPTPQTRETLAFIRDEDVWLVGADGMELRRLTHFAGSGRKVSFLWAPTGLEMVLAAGFVEKDSTAAPIFELATTEGKVLWRKEEEGLTGVHWSLDGKLVALFEENAVRI